MRIILFLAATLYAFGSSAQKATVIGTINGLADETGWFVIDRFDIGSKDTFEIRPSGQQFQLEFNLTHGSAGTLIYKDKKLSFYAFPGKTIELSFDSDFLSTTAKFKGDLAGVNEFLNNISPDLKEKSYDAWINGQAGSASNLDGLEMDLFRDRTAFLKEAKSKDLPEQDLKLLKRHFGYYYYLGLHRFSSLRSAKSKIPKATEIPSVLLEGLTKDVMNKPEEMWSNYYRNLLVEWVSYGALKEYEMMKFGDAIGQMNAELAFAKENLSGLSLQHALSKMAFKYRETIKPSELRKVVTELDRAGAHSDLLKQVRDKLGSRLSSEDENVEVVQEKKSAKHELTLRELSGKDFTLDDLKGKVVYLDIWASWCGPCRKQFPHAKAMKAKLSKKELKKVVFLYISIDNTETAWKKALEQYDLDGKHGFSPGGWNSDVTRVFNVKSIPRYMLFDKKGELVDHNAPRPAEPATLSKIKELIAN